MVRQKKIKRKRLKNERKYVKKIIEKSEIETIKVNTNAKRTIHNLKKKKQDKINFQIQNQIRTQKGITLLALVITIIVLLILAGITIGAITGDNGIIGNAGRAKEEAEIANEKEILEKATVQAMGNNKYGNIEEEELQEQLDKETGEGKAEATDVGEGFEVLFKESNRYYTIDKDGNVGEANIYEEDKYPGDITVGKNGETLDGNTEETAYQIWCIEDLVTFSNMVNGEGIRLENGEPVEITTANNFSGKYVELKTTLNFKSKLSYQNSERTDFGDINGDENDGNTLINEMTTGTGFQPIGINNLHFNGYFDGQGNEIRNIYENTTGYIGLFGVSSGNTIKNIGITGYMETTIDTYAGGLISYANHVTTVSCENCYTDITIIANNVDVVGGLIGRGGTINLENCYNLGNITANKASAGGGIIGYTNTTNIVSCYNQGNVTGNNSGGIVGYSYYGTPLSILNSYNSGKITGTNAGGIVGYQNGVNSNIEIKNSYNIGNVTGTNVGGILNSNVAIPTIENCYNAGILEGSNIESAIIGYGARKLYITRKNSKLFFHRYNRCFLYLYDSNK